MDVRFINPFVASIQNVFETMVNTKVKVGRPQVKRAGLVSAEVSGIIGLSGDAQGCVVLSFSTGVACKAASAFAGKELTVTHPDFADAIGELANMVAGNAKKDFPGCQVSISLPSVVIGPGHAVSQSKNSPFLVIPCETEFGPFDVEVALITGKVVAAAAPKLVTGGVQ